MTPSGTWAPLPADSLFGLQNLPYGIFSLWATEDSTQRRVGVRLGDEVLDVGPVLDRVAPMHAAAMREPFLNTFMALGRGAWTEVRLALQDLLSDEHQTWAADHLEPLDAVRMHLPFAVGDYVDFYSSEFHASNLGRLFRPGSDPLTPNWKHLPIGYHGRAGTVVVSGTDVVRPSGQRKAPTEPVPSFGPSRRLDIEAEIGFVVGVASELGSPLTAADFRDTVFGVVLVDDWSARDIQSWEYVPLGPFLGKSFATSVSAWVVPLDALEAARVPLPVQDPEPLPYLRDDDAWCLDIALEVSWNDTVVSRPPFATTYWSPGQQLAHLTANGASVRTGDLYASGTVSGPGPEEVGSFIELSWNGERPVRLADGSQRTFLEDGDEVTIGASAPGAGGIRIGLGEVTGRILPAGR